MAAIDELVDRFASAERPAGNLLDTEGVLAQAVAAVSFYAGYAAIISRIPAVPETPLAPINGATVLSESEWALIRPLFLFYVERETALQLEASRGLGMDVYGRASSEVASDIMQTELELPHQAFVGRIVMI